MKIVKCNKQYETEIFDCDDKEQLDDEDVVQVLYLDDDFICVDIDIRNGIEKFVFLDIANGYSLMHIDKTFPDVKELEVRPDVNDINIRNKLFPNIQKVVSKSIFFTNNTNLLIYSDCGYDSILQNTFHKKSDEPIDMRYIDTIGNYAFEGCESTNLVNLNTSTINIKKHSFSCSAFEKLPYNNGIICHENILLFIDEKAEHIEIPNNITRIMEWIDFSDKNVIVDDFDKANMFSVAKNRKCHTLTIKNATSSYFDLKTCKDFSFFTELRYNADKVNILNMNDYLKVVDDILYADNGKTLISLLNQKEVDICISESVQRIYSRAFYKSNIKSVNIPDSVKEIDGQAFANCSKLSFVDIGNGVDSLDAAGVFSYCTSLKNIKIPDCVESIGVAAFRGSNLKKIKLPKDIRYIEANAFNGCHIKNITLPCSLRYLGQLSLVDVEDITIQGDIPEGFLYAINQGYITDNYIDFVTVHINDIEFTIPSSISYNKIDKAYNIIRKIEKKHKNELTEEEFEDLYSLYELYTGYKEEVYIKLMIDAYNRGSKRAEEHLTHKYRKICKTFIKNKDENGLVEFFQLFLPVKRRVLLDIKDIIYATDMTIAKAYILDMLGTKRNNKGFTL